MFPAAQDIGDRERFAVVLQQVHALADRLQHAELDAVVHQLDEVAGAGLAGVHITAVDGELAQDRLDRGHRLDLTADHEAGTMARA